MILFYNKRFYFSNKTKDEIKHSKFMKTVLITGVSSGIGYSLTQRFIRAGYKVIGSVRSNSKATELKALFGENFTPIIFDLTDYEAIDKASEKVKSILGESNLCGLINNAGGAKIAPLLHVSMQDFKNALEVLIISQLYVIQKFSSLLIPPEKSNTPVGRIINISSQSGIYGNFGYGCYSAAKHALEGLSKTLHDELYNLYKIRIIIVAPGNVNTNLWNKQKKEHVEKYKDTDYYNILKNRVKSSTSKEALDTMVDVEDFSKLFLTIFEKEQPALRYTIKKCKILIGKTKARAWESTAIREKIMSIITR